MLDAHLPLLLTIALAIGLGAFILVLSAWLGPKRMTPVKADAFECGNPSSGHARYRFAVKFYMVAILFLVFDIEAVFIYPWAVVFSDATRAAQPVIPPLLVVVELNREILERDEYARVTVAEGDQLELVHFVGGG